MSFTRMADGSYFHKSGNYRIVKSDLPHYRVSQGYFVEWDVYTEELEGKNKIMKSFRHLKSAREYVENLVKKPVHEVIYQAHLDEVPSSPCIPIDEFEKGVKEGYEEIAKQQNTNARFSPALVRYTKVMLKEFLMSITDEDIEDMQEMVDQPLVNWTQNDITLCLFYVRQVMLEKMEK